MLCYNLFNFIINDVHINYIYIFYDPGHTNLCSYSVCYSKYIMNIRFSLFSSTILLYLYEQYFFNKNEDGLMNTSLASLTIHVL